MTPYPKDVDALVREKYAGDPDADGAAEDIARLANGEPLAYVIGHVPFLGLSLALDSRPLIPRPETEWWTELLIARINQQPPKQTDMTYHTASSHESGQIRVLDLCAGSGAIGLAVLKHCPNAIVSFGELSEMDADQTAQNLERNRLDTSRADVRCGDLFAPFPNDTWDIIANNPPYIPETRVLPDSVAQYEPAQALYAGSDGLDLIRRILAESPRYLRPQGELWMECDVNNIKTARELALAAGFAQSEIRTDQYGRARLLVSYL